MTVNFSNSLVDTHIAPGVSMFTQATVLDMSAEAKFANDHFLDYFLNSAFSARFAYPMAAYAYNFLRRVMYAHTEFERAREATAEFFSAGRQSPAHYAVALYHWEQFLGQAWHSYALLITAFEGKAFDKKDGSVEQRLNALYNEMKHVESRIEHGQMPPEATVPVWLENVGLRSIDAHLSFLEASDVLKDLAKYADALKEPKTAKQNMPR